MSNKTKVIVLVVLLALVGGVVLYSTLVSNAAVEKNKKKADEEFAKVWNSEEAIEERENALEEIKSIGK